MAVIIFEGPDNLGKSTIINSLVNDYKDVKDICMMHSTGPRYNNGEDPFEYQKKVFFDKVKKIAAFDRASRKSSFGSDDLVLMDRSWIGEYVYGQIYRNGDSKKILDMINTCNIMLMANNIKCVFIQLNASPEFIIEHDDSKSFTSLYDNDKRLMFAKREIDLFTEVFNSMWVDDKLMVKAVVTTQSNANERSYKPVATINSEIKEYLNQAGIEL